MMCNLPLEKMITFDILSNKYSVAGIAIPALIFMCVAQKCLISSW